MRKPYFWLNQISHHSPPYKAHKWFRGGVLRSFMLYATTKTNLNKILLVNFPAKEKMFLIKTLAAENKIPLITQSASLLFKDSSKSTDLSNVKDPIQVFFDNVKTVAPCVCFLNDLETIGEQRNIETHESEIEVNKNITENYFKSI